MNSKKAIEKLKKNYIVIEGNHDLRLKRAMASIDLLLKKV